MEYCFALALSYLGLLKRDVVEPSVSLISQPRFTIFAPRFGPWRPCAWRNRAPRRCPGRAFATGSLNVEDLPEPRSVAASLFTLRLVSPEASWARWAQRVEDGLQAVTGVLVPGLRNAEFQIVGNALDLPGRRALT